MALTTGSGRRYLYVLHSKDRGVGILVVYRLLPAGALRRCSGLKARPFTFLGDYAVAEVLSSSCGPRPTEGRVALHGLRLDEPWACLGFTCVKRAMVVEEGLVYVLSENGLWMVGTSSGAIIPLKQSARQHITST
jgi:hypothetical protein